MSSKTAPIRSTDSSGSRAVITTIASKVVILFMNAATGVLTARALLPAGRGALAAMTLWPLFLTYITTLGIPSATIYVLRNHPSRQTANIVNGFVMSMILGVFAAVAGALLLPSWLGREYTASTVHYAQLFLLTTPLLALTQTGRAVFEANGQFSYSNQLLLLSPATTLVLLLALLGTGHLFPISAAFAYVVSAVPVFLLIVYRLHPLLRESWRLQVETCRLMLNYGIRSYGVDLLGTLALQVDQVLVVSMLPPSQMGAYGVVLSLSRMFMLFQASIVTILFPKASGRPASEVLALVGRSASIGTLATSLTSLAIALFGGQVLGLLYGNEYTNAIGCLRLLLVEVTLSGCVYVLAQAFMALGRPGIVSILQGIGLSFSVPAMLILVPRYGITGAAASLLFSTVARLIFVLWGFRAFLHVPAPSLLPRKDDLRAMLALIPRISIFPAKELEQTR